jgi:hypothetical protein
MRAFASTPFRLDEEMLRPSTLLASNELRGLEVKDNELSNALSKANSLAPSTATLSLLVVRADDEALNGAKTGVSPSGLAMTLSRDSARRIASAAFAHRTRLKVARSSWGPLMEREMWEILAQGSHWLGMMLIVLGAARQMWRWRVEGERGVGGGRSGERGARWTCVGGGLEEMVLGVGGRGMRRGEGRVALV